MGALQKLENQLDIWFNKKAPIQLPSLLRKRVADNLWWLAIIIGILDLWAAIILWQAGHVVDRLVSSYYGALAVATHPHLDPFYYVSVFCLGAVGVLLLLASPGLKALQRRGWELAFYAVVIEVAGAVVRLFASVGSGIFGFFGAMLGVAIGAYFLFQARSNFGSPAKTSAAPKDPETHHEHKADKIKD